MEPANWAAVTLNAAGSALPGALEKLEVNAGIKTDVEFTTIWS